MCKQNYLEFDDSISINYEVYQININLFQHNKQRHKLIMRKFTSPTYDSNIFNDVLPDPETRSKRFETSNSQYYRNNSSHIYSRLNKANQDGPNQSVHRFVNNKAVCPCCANKQLIHDKGTSKENADMIRKKIDLQMQRSSAVENKLAERKTLNLRRYHQQLNEENRLVDYRKKMQENSEKKLQKAMRIEAETRMQENIKKEEQVRKSEQRVNKSIQKKLLDEQVKEHNELRALNDINHINQNNEYLIPDRDILDNRTFVKTVLENQIKQKEETKIQEVI